VVGSSLRTGEFTRRVDIEALVDGTMAKFGHLDCAANNAGISGPVMVPLAEEEFVKAVKAAGRPQLQPYPGDRNLMAS
jgi:NAD(P)-dependent dehydrogenase (short-subunit alcohol dehydrogenase family)